MALYKIKFQAFEDDKVPSDYVDFRGDKWLGHDTVPEDEHATIITIPTSDENIVKAFLEWAPTVNKALDDAASLEPEALADAVAHLALGGVGKLRLGWRLYDGDK
jgi:hypothetical protein